MSLPAAATHLLGFARIARSAGFAVAPEQATAFMRAVTFLGPRSMDDIREAALATLAPPPDHRSEFDALFRAYFWGEIGAVVEGEPGDETRIKDAGGREEISGGDRREEKGGALASAAERLANRVFHTDEALLEGFRRALPSSLPARRSLRTVRASRGKPDLRRSLRAIVRADGDVPSLYLRRRPLVQRKLLLIIDVSGSMKMHTADHLKLAHAVVQSADRAEVFSLGTRLTRITSALKVRDRERALGRASSLVDDWDGGTRLGPTLVAFLSLPRFAAFACGASVVLLTDGLERGDHLEMATAIRRLSARAYRLSLCSPLAGDPLFEPQTAALKAVMPYLDDLVDGSSIQSLTGFILSLARSAVRPSEVWREVS
jgi:uncharacterized protein with von Willebrand factor type A (vWA) domain